MFHNNKDMVQNSSPFPYGRMVEGLHFTGREEETNRLADNFINHINTILLSPRRWGKSSLVKKAGNLAHSQGVVMVYIDAFLMKDEEDFYKMFASAVIKATSNKLEERMATARHFSRRISPKFSMGIDPVNDFEISFDLENLSQSFEDVLNLPEKLAIDKHLHIVVCIDEFQSIAAFRRPKLFQQRLRSVWQHQQNVSYCLCGSKQHMMMELFERQAMPFYKFGDVMYLDKIPLEKWVPFIIERFASSDKTITGEQAAQIAQSVSCHSYYTQQLCHLVWSITIKEVKDAAIENCLNNLLEQNALLYQRDTEELTGYQLNFLKAIAAGQTTNLSTNENLKKIELSTFSNVKRIRNTLLNKELIDISGKKVSFLDSAYELWFKKEILK